MEALAFLIWIALLTLWISAIGWVYRDAEERKGMGCLIALFVLFTGPIGLCTWIVLRPEKDRNQ